MDINSCINLNNNITMPLLGFGVWQIPREQTKQSVLWALEAGYRLIDTAALYGNEEEVGQAIRESGIKREEIFVTTKLSPFNIGKPEESFNRSLRNLDIGYIDLYLIHWPVPIKRNKAWKVLEKIYENKLTRSIGVSNYKIKHLESLKKISYYNTSSKSNSSESLL